MTNRSRIAITGSMLLLILLVALVATNPEMREQTLVEMGLAEASNKTLRATGFLELPTIVLASGTGGRVEAVHIEEGEIVSADESLLSFDKEALLALRDAASARLSAADEDIAAARAAVEAARAEVAATDYKLAEQDIRSPWKGIVLSIFREAGEWTFPGAPAILLGKTDEFFMDVFVSEDDLASVAVGQQVQIAVESVTQRSFPGLVVKIASEAEFTPRTLQDAEQQNILLYKVEISIEASMDELKPGLIGEVDFGGEA
jgi:multidrug resistance efflux pump